MGFLRHKGQPASILPKAVLLALLLSQSCYSVNIAPKGPNTQVRNNLRKPSVANIPAASNNNANTFEEQAKKMLQNAGVSARHAHKAAPTANSAPGLKQFKIPQQIPHPPSALVPETKHATSTADSLLAAFAPITKRLKIDHCVPKSSDHLIRSFDAHISPNPVKKGAPLKIFASAEMEKVFKSGTYILEITAFGFPVLNQTDDICRDSTGFIPTLGPVAISGLKCPVAIHHKAEVVTTITVPSQLVDGVNIRVKIYVENQDKEPVMCEDTAFET